MLIATHKRIYLTGFMGSGKTTIGKKIASKIGFTFIDLDNYIESKHFKTVAEIFLSEGEEQFRKYESLCLKELSNIENIVISCGGGTPCFNKNMDIMNSTGFTIYLKHDIPTLVSRLINSKKKNARPLILGKSKKELVEFVSQLLPIREPFYLKSKIILNVKSSKFDDLIEIIKQNLI